MKNTTTSLSTPAFRTVPDVIAGLTLMATTRAFGSGADFPREAVTPATTKNWFKGTIVSPLDHAPAHRLVTRLEAYRRTPEEDRWPDADWPDGRAFTDARTFIERLPLPSIPTPEISLANDGEINFLWESDDVYVDLGFYGTGTYSYFARGKNGQGIHGEDVPASKGLSVEIVELFSV